MCVDSVSLSLYSFSWRNKSQNWVFFKGVWLLSTFSSFSKLPILDTVSCICNIWHDYSQHVTFFNLFGVNGEMSWNGVQTAAGRKGARTDRLSQQCHHKDASQSILFDAEFKREDQWFRIIFSCSLSCSGILQFNSEFTLLHGRSPYTHE